MNNKPQTLKGFRDFLPSSMRVRNHVKDVLVSVFQNYGFQPLETPTLEYASTLTGKYGEDADKLVYTFKDKGDREVGLRYDLTVPAAKVLAIYQNDISLPFKRYQIQSVWRADKPQKGRYREFTQCDIDIYGTSSPLAEAELVAIIYQVLNKLNFKKFQIKLNSRTVLYQILELSGIKDGQSSVLQSLDKFDKIGKEGVTKELISKGLEASTIDTLFKYIKEAQPDETLKAVLDAVSLLGVPKEFYSFSPTLVRGLDYYTGPIIETSVEEPKIGSIGGGGRYDTLVKTLGGPDLPATGYAFGFDRLVDVIEELNLLPQLKENNTKVMFANFDPNTLNDSLKLLQELRDNSIASIIYPDNDKLGKQFKYADANSIKYVALIGSDEAKDNLVTVKNMSTGNQETLKQSELINYLSQN